MSKKKKNSCSGSLILLDLRARDRSFTFHWVKGPTLRYFYKKILCRFFFLCVCMCVAAFRLEACKTSSLFSSPFYESKKKDRYVISMRTETFTTCMRGPRHANLKS